MQIQPLSKKNIEETIELARKIFPEDENDDNPSVKGFWASLEPNKHKEYFVAIDEKTDKVIGITGLYSKTTDPDSAWLGWYGVSPDCRGKGLGKELLKWTIEKARERNYSAIRLYTTDDPNEAIAQKLYEKFGLKIIDEAKLPPQIVQESQDDTYKTFFRELKF